MPNPSKPTSCSTCVAKKPASKPGLHVRDAGAAGDVALDRERTVGDGPVVEDRVHVTHEQDVRSPRPPEGPDHEVAEPRLSVVRPPIDLPSVIEEPALAEVRDPVDTLRASTSRSRR